jgi:hypothetical protein
MDEFFAVDGPYHRKHRHHREGVAEARSLFGSLGEKAATIHILRDCRHIPSERDYRMGFVDALGLKKEWSTAAYIKYSEEDFENVVQQSLKPSGVMLWSFIDSDAIRVFLLSMTRLGPDEVEQIMPTWREAVARKQSLPQLPIGAATIRTVLSKEVQQFMVEAIQRPLMKSIAVTFPSAEISYVPLDTLINPLFYVDYEYLEALKPELNSTSDLDVARFAIPENITTQLKIAPDPTGKSVTFVSNEKALTISPLQIRETPEGTEVRWIVASNLTAIMVTNYSGRLILRNGIHRAFLLARMGLKEIPCILLKEDAPPNIQTTAYPAFTPSTLMQLRPPLLIDLLNPDLSVQVPLQRSHKVIRVSAEEMILPVD